MSLGPEGYGVSELAAKWNAFRAQYPARKVNQTWVQSVLGVSTLRGLDLTGINLAGANLASARLSATKLRGANLAWANLEFATLNDARLNGAILCGANLRETSLRRTTLIDADLTEARLIRSVMVRTNLRRADLTGALVAYVSDYGANYRDTILTDVQFHGLAGQCQIENLVPRATGQEAPQW